MVDIYNIIHNYLFNNLLLYVFSVTFKRVVKLVELISSSSHMVAMQILIKINKVCVLATCVTWNSVYLINLGMKEEPFSDKYQ